MKLWNTKHALALAVAGLMALASQSGALSIGDANYLGTLNDGIPSKPANEISYINNLITLSPNASDILLGTETYNRLGSTLTGPFATAVLAGAVKDDTGIATINATGFTYILGKYDASQAGSLVWYFEGGAAGDVTLPETFNGKGISHISLFNLSPSVPDAASTLSLLGLGLLALETLRRKLQA